MSDSFIPAAYSRALEQLRRIAENERTSGRLESMKATGHEVREYFAPYFKSEGLANLTAEQFLRLLWYRYNKHWQGLQRLGGSIISDMPALRAAIRELLDESRPIAERLDSLLPNGRPRILRLGKAVLTPILMIVYPDRYGVWNATSEGMMRQVGLLPEWPRGTSKGERYRRINELLLELSRDADVDLWCLDSLWWQMGETIGTDLPVDTMRTGSIETPPSTCSGTFGLERHLHFFLRENWHLTELGRDWSLVEDDEGNVDGAGSERITPIGRIDLLAKHRTEPRWLVVELKRWQADDQTVAQLLRYMGWVKTDLATVDEQVEGLIIASEETNRLQYALKPVPSASFMRYEVDFRLVRGR